MRRHYCCYFDHRYLPRGVAMIRSLRRFDPGSEMWVLCLNDACHELMTMLTEPGVRLIRLAELEAADPELSAVKLTRTLVEYYFTCTPSLIRFVQERVPANALVTYVDGDLWFFSDPEPLFAELGSGAVSIVPHRFAQNLLHLEQFGAYNVGWLTFRNDERGVAVARWWRERCIEWCYDYLDNGRFADQKYLEQFAKLFQGVVVLQHPGANLAPWNLGRHHVTVDGNGTLLADGKPVVFFHFHGLRTLGRMLYFAEHARYGAPWNSTIKHRLYRPYVSAVASINAQVQSYGQLRGPTLARHVKADPRPWADMLGSLKRPLKNLESLLRGQFLLVIRGRAL